jgi:BASS family bile acid:Na+ symporter
MRTHPAAFMLSRVLVLLSTHGTWILAGGVFLGLAWPQAARFMGPMLAPSVFLILTASLVRLDWPATVGYARRPLIVIVSLVALMGLAPIAAAFVVSLVEPPPGLGKAIVLMAAASPVMAAIAFSQLLDLDAALAMMLSFAGTLLAPLTVPPLALALLGIELKIGTGDLMLRLGVIAFGAAAVAALIRRIVPREVLYRRRSEIDGIAVAMLLIFALSIMNGVADAIAERPGFVATATGLAFASNIALQIAATVLFLWAGPRQALTVGLACGNRNMGLLLAALAGTADFDVVLFFAIGQIPMYVLPALQRPLYRRVLPARS